MGRAKRAIERDPRRHDVASEMAFVPGGTFAMGSDRHYPEEAPVHRVTFDEFWIDQTPVPNRQFHAFVKATGHVTVAEKRPDPNDYPGALSHMLNAGSLVFDPPGYPVDLSNWSQWWTFRFGTSWYRPYGPGSSVRSLDDYPVVHVAYSDAEAYARLAGKDLPTEAEWEYAARGGLDGAEFAWGRRANAGRSHDGEHLAGRLTVPEHVPRWVRAPCLGFSLGQRLPGLPMTAGFAMNEPGGPATYVERLSEQASHSCSIRVTVDSGSAP